MQAILAFGFGVVFLAALLAIVIFIPTPTDDQMVIFRIVIAVAAGGAAAIIPGFIDLNMSRGSAFALRAGGALAVFVIVYFFDPAARLKSNTTHGDASPININNKGPVENNANIQKK
jgi:hypothetical protein